VFVNLTSPPVAQGLAGAALAVIVSSSAVLLSGLELSDTKVYEPYGTSPRRNRCTFLLSSCSYIEQELAGAALAAVAFFLITLIAGPRRSLSLKLSDTRVYEPQIRARLGTRGWRGRRWPW